MKIFHDEFGNTATIVEQEMLPFMGSKRKEKGFVLSLTADYEGNFMYFRSVYPSEEDALDKLKKCSCDTWKQI